MSRIQIINNLIEQNKYTDYLEIGLADGKCFNSIVCQNKESVDPAKNKYKLSKPTHKMTSDEFFEQCHPTRTWDIIFIDGLHHADQVYRDIQNSLKHLQTNGTIVCHDMNPVTEEAQIVPRKQSSWNGDCWKAFVRLRTERTDLEMFVYDTDHGVGIIKFSETPQERLSLGSTKIEYKHLVENRIHWLNLKQYP